MNVKLISFFIENHPGTLYDITKALADENIHIHALTTVEAGSMCLVRLLVDNVLWTSSVLKNIGVAASFVDILVARISHVPGGLSKVLEVMKKAEVNIEHMYSVISNTGEGTENKIPEAYVAFEVNDVNKAILVLKAAGIGLVSQEELFSL
ncbi:MAG: hypothetical protein IJP97_08170 [Synergistaceae bacterium]|nr:hypothetical protein [Synergistaceae bacterium]MBR0070455.1 hypothetical protein [Synergistaceae bacterium]